MPTDKKTITVKDMSVEAFRDTIHALNAHLPSPDNIVLQRTRPALRRVRHRSHHYHYREMG